MHFWIDKRSQGCGFNGRHLVPHSLSGYGRNQRLLCGGLHPKPMVTPVHRFQSIESVANNGLRPGRASSSRNPSNHQYTPPNNGASCSGRPHHHHQHHNPQMGRTIDMITAGQTHIPTCSRRNSAPTAKLKCGVWVFFAIVTFFLAGAKYYFHGVNIGMEAFAFCSLLVIILIIGGLVSLYEAITATPVSGAHAHTSAEHSAQLSDEISTQNQVPQMGAPEMPPPPYHIAVLLPSQRETTVVQVQVIGDSPPPPYEKVVS